MFPMVYAIVVNEEELVASVGVRQRQMFVWNVHFRRDVQDWELDQLVDLLGFLFSVKDGRDREDSLVWDCSRSKGVFSVFSFYGMLEGRSGVVFPWKSIWATGSPSKVAFFVWTAALGKILTIDNLIRREHVLANWCCTCCRDGKMVDHLLLHCPVGSRLWNSIVALFGCNRGRCWVWYKVGVGLGWGSGVGRLGFLLPIVFFDWCGWSEIGVFFRMSAISFYG
ncbi:hypothetical protein CsSME_00039460 [Camellia sinensis var. sinensis]